jgi:ferredoxin
MNMQPELLFRSRRPSRARALRPPGALSESQFTDKCVRCLDCLSVCPKGALSTDDAGYPCLTNPNACGQCGLCADVCTRGAIGFTEATRKGLRAVLATERRLDF